jgi:hypothetical protein
MKTIKVKYDETTGEHYLRLKDFKELVDIELVKKYSLKPVFDVKGDTMALIIKFYDENDNIVEAKI